MRTGLCAGAMSKAQALDVELSQRINGALHSFRLGALQVHSSHDGVDGLVTREFPHILQRIDHARVSTAEQNHRAFI